MCSVYICCGLILSLILFLFFLAGKTSMLGPVQTWVCPGTKMDVVQIRQCSKLKMFINN